MCVDLGFQLDSGVCVLSCFSFSIALVVFIQYFYFKKKKKIYLYVFFTNFLMVEAANGNL